MDLGGKMRREIVAIEADVKRAERNVGAFDLLDLARKTMSEQVASGEDSHQGDVRGAVVGLENLVRDARERSLNFVCVHTDGFHCSRICHSHPLPIRDAGRPLGSAIVRFHLGEPLALLVGLSVPLLKDCTQV